MPPAKEEERPKPGFVERVKTKFRNFMIRGLGALRQPPAFGAVHIARAESYDADLLAVLKAQFEHFRPHVPLAGKRVVLKPNLVEYTARTRSSTPTRGSSTPSSSCARREGAAEIIVAEGPGHWRNVEFLVEESGLGDGAAQARRAVRGPQPRRAGQGAEPGPARPGWTTCT